MIQSRNPIKILSKTIVLSKSIFCSKMYPLKVKIKWTINSYVSNKIQNFQWPKNQCAFVKDVRVTVKKKKSYFEQRQASP